MQNYIQFTLALLVILSCDHFSDVSQKKTPFYPGMSNIPAEGKSFIQGWDDVSATLDEKPATPSYFSSDYWLDTIEVTQEFYQSLTGKNPVPATTFYGRGNYFPVYNVTWFDAVLFCNARSKAESIDTVYSYSHIDTLPNGSVINLTGITCNFTRDGYRLPTEAEWEFAARDTKSSTLFSSYPADSSEIINYAWYAANAGDQAHSIGEKKKNGYGLYDIFGNVFEWTNDWKNSYDGKPITNSLRALQPNSEYKKVIKGGAFCFDRLFLRPSYRSATYATLLSSATYYVGFRCTQSRCSKIFFPA